MAKKKTTTKKTTKSNGANGTHVLAEPGGEDPQVKVEYFEQQLAVKLTQEERIGKALTLVERLTERDNVELEMKDTASEYRARIKTIEAEADKIMACVRDGAEERTVKCVEIRNYRTGSVTVKRTDTHEVIDERAMESDERQLELDAVVDEPGVGDDTDGTPIEQPPEDAPAP